MSKKKSVLADELETPSSVKHMMSLKRKSMSKGFVLSTGLDYSVPGCKGVGFPNVIIIRGVKTNEEALAKAEKIVRQKYEETKIRHEFALLRSGEIIGRIISPDRKDCCNLPLCDFCYEKGEKRDGRYEEIYNGNIQKHSCSRHLIEVSLLRIIATRISVSIYDLYEEKEIFSL